MHAFSYNMVVFSASFVVSSISYSKIVVFGGGDSSVSIKNDINPKYVGMPLSF